MPARIVLGTGESLAERAEWARGARARSRGLVGRRPLEPGAGLLIDRGRQIHTLGMRYPIDVLFCDRAWRVLHVVRCMPPRRVTKWVRGARYVIELPCGSLTPAVARGALVEVTED